MDFHNLEAALEECSNPLTTSERRREIERTLFVFDDTDNSWSFYLQILSSPTSSALACHLAISMLENKVVKKWNIMTADSKIAIRSSVNGLVEQVVSQHAPVAREPVFIRKLLRLCADIARHDWPHEYSDFVDSIFRLCQSNDFRQAAIGFVFLRTVSEEFTDDRALFSTQRRAVLRSLFEQLLPQIGQYITFALDAWIVAFPDKSLTHNRIDQLGDVALEALSCLSHLFTWAPLYPIFEQQQLSLNDSLFQIFANGYSSPDAKLRSGSSTVLSCIAELFGRQRCMAKDASVILQMASSLFQLVAHMVIPQLEQARHDPNLNEASNALLDGITNCFSTFFAACFTPLILNHSENNQGVILNDLLSLLAKYTLSQPDSDALCACLEIWASVMESLVSSASPSALVPVESIVIDFVQNLLIRAMFTTNQRELDELDDGDGSEGPVMLHQFGIKSPSKPGENLDNSNCDFDGIFGDNAESDYQLIEGDGSDLPKAERFFIGVSVVVRQIAVAYPKAVIENLLLKSTQEKANHFVEITGSLVAHRILNSNVRAIDAARIHCISRDLATLVSLVAGVADLMDPGVGYSVFSSLSLLTLESCKLVSHAEKSTSTSPLREDLVRLHSRLFASLRAVFIHMARPILLGTLTAPRSTNEATAQHLNQAVMSAIDAAVELIFGLKPPEICRASVPFLYACLASRIPILVQSPSFSKLSIALKADPCNDTMLQQLGSSLYIQLCSGLVASYFLPLAGFKNSEQDWTGKKVALSHLFSHAISPNFNITFLTDKNSNDSSKQIRLVWLKTSLRLITAVCRLVASESTHSKQLVISCLVLGEIAERRSNTLDTCLSLIPLWQLSSDMEGVLAVLAFLSAVVNLQAQLETDKMEHLIQTVMDSFRPQLVCDVLLAPRPTDGQSQKYNHQLVAAFLSILRHVFDKGDFASIAIQRRNKSFLTASISYCLDYLRPAITANDASITSVLPSFINLLETIVADNWNYFSRKFGSTSGLGGLLDNVDRMEEQHFHSLVSIVETLFSFLLLHEVEVVRKSIAALNRIDKRCRLFSRHFFATSTSVTSAVCMIILTALLNGGQDLLRDDMLVLLHSINEKAETASASLPTVPKAGFQHFFHSILPIFVASRLHVGSPVVDDLLSPFGQMGVHGNLFPADQPSFTAVMARFITDLRYSCTVFGDQMADRSGHTVGWLVSATRLNGQTQGHN